MLADAAALALAIFAQRIATQTRTRARTYGYRRAEVLAAFANGIALGLTAILDLRRGGAALARTRRR